MIFLIKDISVFFIIFLYWFWINLFPDLLCGNTSDLCRESKPADHLPLSHISTPPCSLHPSTPPFPQCCPATSVVWSKLRVQPEQSGWKSESEEEKKHFCDICTVKQVNQWWKRVREENKRRGERRRDFSIGTQSMRWREEERGEHWRGNNEE